MQAPSEKEGSICTRRNLPPVDWRFKTFGDPELERMLAAVEDFAAGMACGCPPRWLSLLGTNGTGKTHLAKRVYRYYRVRAGWRKQPGRAGTVTVLKSGQFVDWREFVNTTRNGGWQWLEDIKNDWFVVLDDIGAERDPNGLAIERLDAIANARLGKWTLITSNLPLESIAALDTRIASRMKRGGSVVVQVDTLDYVLRS